MRTHAAPVRSSLQSLMRPVSLLLATLLALSAVTLGTSPAAADHDGPHFGSATTATAIVGEEANITAFVPTGGSPPYQVYGDSSAWPDYLTVQPDGRITGTPPTGSAGAVFTSDLTAFDSYDAHAETTITVTIKARATFTSAASTTFIEGSEKGFDVTTTGSFPTAALSIDTLPAGLSFTDNGNGSGRISGIPEAGTAGTYDLTLTARGDDEVSSTQDFTLTVAKPTFSSVPAPVIDGVAKVGNQLSVSSEPTAPVADSTTYTWLRNGDPVHTGSSYDVVVADLDATFTVRATSARTGYDDAVATSAPVTIAPGEMTQTSPSYINGNATVGTRVWAITGSTSPAPDDITYQWTRDGEPITGATGPFYWLSLDDAGHLINVDQTVSKEGYADQIQTGEGREVPRLTFDSGPAISVTGDPVAFETLEATTGDGDPVPDSTELTWRRDGDPIAGADQPSYTLTAADVGAVISVSYVNRKAGYDDASVAWSSPTIAPTQMSEVYYTDYSGAMLVGRTLEAYPGTTSPVADGASYQWTRVGEPIAGATGTSYTLTGDDAQRLINLKVTFFKAGYADHVQFGPSRVVRLSNFEQRATVTIDGDFTVFETVTARTLTSASPTPDSTRLVWRRDSVPIEGATGTSYTLTPADVGTGISVTLLSSKAGYFDSWSSSSPTTVEALTFTGAPEVIVEGDAQVAVPVNAVVTTDPTPEPDSLAYQWTRDGEPLEGATEPTYTPQAADAGGSLQVRVRAIKAGYDDAVASSEAVIVANGVFEATPTVTVTGRAAFDEVLVADVTSIDPAVEDVAYQWLADGQPIAETDSDRYVVRPVDENARLSVRVTATADGYDPASVVSEETASVVNSQAPTLVMLPLTFTVLGEPVTFTWRILGAATATSTGPGFTHEDLPMTGTVTLPADRLGSFSYTLTAVGTGGETSRTFNLEVARPAKALNVSVAKPAGLRGRWAQVRVGGLAQGEAYTMTVGGMKVRGISPGGVVTRFVRLKHTMVLGRKVVTVTGDRSNRVGRTTLVIVKAKRLTLSPAARNVRATTATTVRVSGLVSGEQVTARYRGRVVTPKGAQANQAGAYTVRFNVGRAWGKRPLAVTGSYPRRHAKMTLSVYPSKAW